MCDARCHVVDLAWTTPSFPLSAAKHSCQQLQDGARLHGNRNIRPYHPLPTDSTLLDSHLDSHPATTNTTTSPHHSIVPFQHHLLPAHFRYSSIHTPYTPPSLNICTLHYTASIRCSLTRPPITARTPSSETRATTLHQAV
jgi:hypothetical protein